MKQLAIDPKALVQQQTASQAVASISVSAHGYATTKAGQLLSLYRRNDAQDPETYVAGVAAVLSEYPSDVIDVLCDPRTGIARRLKWLPTIAEVSEFCEELMRPRREHEAWQRRVRAQIAEREAVFGKGAK